MTIFSRIIAGEIPCYKIAENDRFFAFLDINPVNWGHTLVVPKQETDYIFDLDDDTLAAMAVFAKRVAAAIKKTVPCRKVASAVLGLEVPHAHIHLIPIEKEGIWISATRSPIPILPAWPLSPRRSAPILLNNPFCKTVSSQPWKNSLFAVPPSLFSDGAPRKKQVAPLPDMAPHE